MKDVISMSRWLTLQIQIKDIATFLTIFGAHMKTLFIIKVKILVGSLSGHVGPP